MMNGLALTPFFMMRIALTPGFLGGLALTPCLTLGLALIPFLVMGLALYPFCRIWFPVCTSTLKNNITEGISIAHLSTMTLMVS
jgi:hypothetical protein